ncbi:MULTISPECIES: pseudouridine synthase [Mycoplasma]|uniref:Ribosomal large subunit pseudouridine synthase B n=3 Tax=Mycoplasma TaxID=2093 RepID=S6G8K6_9MOLU|nr:MULTISPECIES: pseudouridine synthase [Mycoplasma]AJM71762.1 ribosomal large subunit pseudouridine synthase B [Mycoplasma yeatsii GM274B]EOA07509.1 Ribosomal large subunit pseudouridine synthase B [Mycoplasma yeatsii 13926]MDQ0567774.1 23S rRNA pseudouridine2605 synthase [Mycoplasma yeatsii]UWD35306.1 rRNA pseudouridine synthase [Mycoplasma cottewii]
MKERLQKVIASRGYASRRAAEKLITQGRVKVDGIVVTELGTKVEPNAKIEINNKEVISDSNNQKYYYLFYKPRLVLTTMYDPKKRKTVADYFKDLNHRVYPIGRLDYDVSGLLIMTNDGEMSNFIMHPRYEFFKTYQGMCSGQVSKKQVAQLVKGVTIDENYFTKAIDAKLLKYDKEKNISIVELTIAEGRKHHVKKMFEAGEMNLVKLMRTKIEFLEIGDLKPGEYRELKPNEVKKLYGVYKSIKQKDR